MASASSSWTATPYEGQICHAPDAALLDEHTCGMSSPMDGMMAGSNLSWPYRADEAAALHLSAKYLGAVRKTLRGYVLSPHSFWEIAGRWYRCPAIELLPYRSLLDQFLFRNRRFSSPGDSGSWIANERNGDEWLGMINADRDITKSSFATEGRFLAAFYLEELKLRYGNGIRIELEAI